MKIHQFTCSAKIHRRIGFSLFTNNFTIIISDLPRVSDENEESPPEPAPPEVPPRGPSLHSATLRRRTDFEPTQESQFLSQGGEYTSGSCESVHALSKLVSLIHDKRAVSRSLVLIRTMNTNVSGTCDDSKLYCHLVVH